MIICLFRCEFNSIEWVWGACKIEFRKRLMLRQSGSILTELEFRQMVSDVCNSVGRQHWRNMVNANRKYIAKYLPYQ